MAQAKTRASATRSRGSGKSPARSRSSSSKSRTSSKSANASRNRSKSSSNGAARVDSARHMVENKAKGAGRAVGSAASKAKVPLVAGGAALAGAAGGLALGTRQARRHKGMGIAIPRRPRVKVNSRDLARAAKEVGGFGTKMGHLATELQHVREANGDKHRSPVEVVLEGLTARRSRA